MDPFEELLRAKYGGKPKGTIRRSFILRIEKKPANKLYQILGVEPTASTATITKAYKELMKKEKDEAKIAEIEKAYHILSDPDRREAYDRHGEEALREEPEESEDFQNLFDILRGKHSGAKMKPKRGKMKPIQAAFEVTLDEIYAGIVKKAKVKRMRICKSCLG